MVSTSKILTVSYGTFSCTLEGFDDSFGTMKAIAEYFRDLAADDRYFGAEPPAPDADMLARIAERGISRRVEMRETDGAVHLRADTGGRAAASAPPETRPAASGVAAGDEIAHAASAPTADEAAGLDRPDWSGPGATPAAAVETTGDDSIADKLRRIRAVAAPPPGGFAPSEYDGDEQDFLGVSQGAALGAELTDVGDTRHVATDEEDRPAPANAQGGAAAAPVPAQTRGPETSVRRLDDDAMPAHAGPPAAAPPGGSDKRTAEVEEVVHPVASGAPQEEDAPSETVARDEDDTIAQLLADALLDDGNPATIDARADPRNDSGTTGKLDSAFRPDPPARVVKVKRADLDAAIAADNPGQAPEETGTPPDLSADAEADLLRELAEVETELQPARAPQEPLSPQGENPGAPTMQDPQQTVADAEQRTPRKARIYPQDAPDAQASRMFDEADTQLSAPESNKRRSAIQHLRAAVAATRAERRIGGAMDRNVDDRPYRDDLQCAVRPRRPQGVAPATPRPDAQAVRPAPLKLVAEQRIDMPANTIRPRRIIRADLAGPAACDVAGGEDAAPKPGGFADYAEGMGAGSLTDLLEAAAAFMADVENMPEFSRPMLMQKLREAHAEGFSREEGLHSLGQLLRQGKLQKRKGGRFAVTDETGFRRD